MHPPLLRYFRRKKLVINTRDGVYAKIPFVSFALRKLYHYRPSIFLQPLPISKLLLGGENGLCANAYAQLTDDILRPSTPLLRSPHLDLLYGFERHGDALLEMNRLSETRYFQNAMQCVDIFGVYFAAKDGVGVQARAREFTSMLLHNSNPSDDPSNFYRGTPPGIPPRVRRIRYSDCFEILDGHHRLALAAFRGYTTFPCIIAPKEPIFTPAQHMVMDSFWTESKKELFQPLDLPELASWPVAYDCKRRLEMMLAAMSQRGILRGSYLDLRSGYGWFVSQMSKRGFDCYGVDRNAVAAKLGQLVYGLDPAAIVIRNLIAYLRAGGPRYDIVSFFNIAQHPFLRCGLVSPEELLGLIDAVTNRAFFIDVACHETSFCESLKDLAPSNVAQWLRKNTSFPIVELLGADHDQEENSRNNNRRHLFGCFRS